MKKLLFFIFALFCSKGALADGGIPLLVFVGSNLFITGNFIFPFCYGFILFWFVCSIERRYLVKKLKIKEKIYKSVIVANIYSTLLGIPLSIGFFYLQAYLCRFISSCTGECQILCVLIDPFVSFSRFMPSQMLIHILEILWILFEFFLFGWMSWFVEYRSLKRKLNHPHLKKYTAFANFYSYLGLIIIFFAASIIRFAITEHERKVALEALKSCETTCKVYASKTNSIVQSWEEKGFFCMCDVINKETQKYGSHIVARQNKTVE